MLSFFTGIPDNYLILIAFILGGLLSFLLIGGFKAKLPTDIGRAFAVNAQAAKGKPRGAGLIFILVFVCTGILVLDCGLEFILYGVLLILAMLTGFLDDASRSPWGEYKKGLFDLLISLLISIVFVTHNPTVLNIQLTGTSIELPVWLYVILGTMLVWISINVTNCTDGVDGLSSSLTLVTLGSFFFFMKLSGSGSFYMILPLMAACVGAYLIYNASPSILLMGDAGSRTLGCFFAITAMKTGSPLLFIPFCLVFIIDGGLGLIKVSLLRFLKIKILKNTRTPIHDHFRKNKGWSDTQTVIRFVLIQLLTSIIYLCLIIK